MIQPAKKLKAGDVFNVTKGPVTTTQIVMYAGASGDFNRIHFDQPFAIEAGLGGILAHGMLTMGFAASCLSEMFDDPAQLKSLSTRFLAPVHVNDTVQVVATVGAADGAVFPVTIEARVAGVAVLAGTAMLLDGTEPARP